MSKLLFGNYCPSLRKKHDGEIGIETMHKQPGVNIVNIFDLCLRFSVWDYPLKKTLLQYYGMLPRKTGIRTKLNLV